MTPAPPTTCATSWLTATKTSGGAHGAALDAGRVAQPASSGFVSRRPPGSMPAAPRGHHEDRLLSNAPQARLLAVSLSASGCCSRCPAATHLRRATWQTMRSRSDVASDHASDRSTKRGRMQARKSSGVATDHHRQSSPLCGTHTYCGTEKTAKRSYSNCREQRWPPDGKLIAAGPLQRALSKACPLPRAHQNHARRQVRSDRTVQRHLDPQILETLLTVGAELAKTQPQSWRRMSSKRWRSAAC